MEEDVFLSDIHIYTENAKVEDSDLYAAIPDGWKDKVKVAQSRFVFGTRDQGEKLEPDGSRESLVSDEDGDLLIERKKLGSTNVVSIFHLTATPLSLVGSQVWRGATYLADFVLHNGASAFGGQSVLELGGGTGLCSILVSSFARRVFCTDRGLTHLEICRANVESNGSGGVKVRELDWTHSHPLATGGKFGWSEEDKRELSGVRVLMCSDVVYDDKLTDSFLTTVEWLRNCAAWRVAYLSVEKRINFNLETLNESSPAYDYFMNKLKLMESRYHLRRLQDFPQYLDYQRVPELELWAISPKE